MNFLFRGKDSGCFLLTKFTVTLLLESLVYLEAGKRWYPSMFFWLNFKTGIVANVNLNFLQIIFWYIIQNTR